jgi:drug/metabolite transporter (DMT)-like permease
VSTVPTLENEGRRHRAAPLELVVSSILFGLMAFEAKRASARIPGPEVAFFRFAVGLGVVAAMGMSGRWRPRFRRYDLLLVRGLLGGIAVLIYFSTIAHLDVSIGTLLNYTSPVFIAILSPLTLRERIGGKLLLALGATLAGVFLLTRAHAPPGSVGLSRWELLGLLGALCSAGAVTGVRGLRLAAVGSWEILAAFCLFGALCTAPQTFHTYARPTAFEWRLLAEIGLLGIAGQILLNRALGDVRATVAGTILQLTPVLTLILGACLLGEPVSAQALIGAGLTLTGVVGATRLSARGGRSTG